MYSAYKVIDATNEQSIDVRGKVLLDWLGNVIVDNMARFTEHDRLSPDKIWGVIDFPDRVYIKCAVLDKLLKAKHTRSRFFVDWAKKAGYLITLANSPRRTSTVKWMPHDKAYRCYCFPFKER